MAQPSKPRVAVSDPTTAPAPDKTPGDHEESMHEKHGIPPEMAAVKDGAKGTPHSDREGAEIAAVKQDGRTAGS